MRYKAQHGGTPSGEAAYRRANKRTWYFRFAKELLIGGGILALLLALVADGTAWKWYEQVFKARDIEHRAEAFYGALTDPDTPLERRLKAAQDLLDQEAKPLRDSATLERWRLDPYVWSDVSTRLDGIDGNIATLGPADSHRWAIRRATSGCQVLTGHIKLRRRNGVWYVQSLPSPDPSRSCDHRELQSSWAGDVVMNGYPEWTYPYGIPRWASRRLQRVDVAKVTDGGAEDPSCGLSRCAPSSAVDTTRHYDRRMDLTVRRPALATAWRSRALSSNSFAGDPNRSVRSGLALAFTFARPVRVLRLRMRNGSHEFLKHGRIATAEVTGWHGRRPTTAATVYFASELSRQVTQVVNCDLGSVDRVTLQVTAVEPVDLRNPVRSDVALSDVEFWGVAGRAPHPPAPGHAYAVPRALPDGQQTATCDSTAPDPAPAVGFSTAAEGSLVTFFGSVARGAPVKWAWNFGDGSAGKFGPEVQHRFQRPGPFVVTLRASDRYSRTAEQVQRVDIGAEQTPPASVPADVTAVPQPASPVAAVTPAATVLSVGAGG